MSYDSARETPPRRAWQTGCETGLRGVRVGYEPALARRASRIAAATGNRAALLSADLKFHSLRLSYASLCVAAGITPLEIARFMGRAKATTTLAVYAHLFEDDHADAMGALGAMVVPKQTYAGNFVPLRGSGAK